MYSDGCKKTWTNPIDCDLNYTESEQVCEIIAAVPLGINETKRKILRIFFKFQYKLILNLLSKNKIDQTDGFTRRSTKQQTDGFSRRSTHTKPTGLVVGVKPPSQPSPILGEGEY
jgi:hypothetical protein